MQTSPFMKLALESAQSVRGRTVSNPWVGAVLVEDGRVVSRGATAPPGGPHAESTALAGVDARGCTLYVTLEPCVAFEGKRTAPCAQAIVEAGVARVVVAMLDPDRRVSGRGVAVLREAGIAVEIGDGASEALQLIRPYLKHAQLGLPYVLAKFAVSLDGRTATASGDSKWITGSGAREHSHQQRAWVDAVMVGSGTVLADDPALTARPGGVLAERQPVRIVLDSRGRTPPDSAIFGQPGTVFVATAASAPGEWKREMTLRGAKLIECESDESGVNVNALLAVLGQRNIGSIWVEGGGTLLSSLLADGHVDEVWAYIAPVLIGGDGLSAVRALGIQRVADALRLAEATVETLPPDVLVRGNTQNWAPRLVSTP
ncbi:MAG: bifunctional diaminohydroxyphosphoribosylaminopyrimidine deaminase/5-amino-6-(5-phosphoribosylamino)uracil reductase RibD [Tepidiformaceae bacterium]